MGVSLVSGTAPWAMGVVAVALLAGSLVRRRPGWRSRMLVEAGAAGALTGIVDCALRTDGLLRDHIPPSFHVWVGLVVFAGVTAAAEWKGTAWWHRAVSLMAVPATAALAGLLINLHYGYYPNLAALLGQRAVDQATPRQLDETAARAQTTGRLPDRGKVVPADFPATVSGFHARPGLVYLPPAWFAEPRPELPAILMLAGTPGQPDDWTRAGGADQAADRWAVDHHGLAPILVFADQNGSVLGDTECVDSAQSRPETYLADDVRQYVVTTYGASADPARWAVAGLSEGGTCALTLALRHPDRFHVLADFSGELGPNVGSRLQSLRRLFGGSRAAMGAYDSLALLRERRFPGLAARFEAGDEDARSGAVARLLGSAARAAGIDAHVETGRGGHAFAFWRSAFAGALPWLTAELSGETPAPSSSELTEALRALPSTRATASPRPASRGEPRRAASAAVRAVNRHARLIPPVLRGASARQSQTLGLPPPHRSGTGSPVPPRPRTARRFG